MAELHFFPTDYHLAYGLAPPALTIRPGDKIFTRLADAHGYDETGGKVTGSPNPLTGPFVIEGVHPGDTLAVSLQWMAPNRKRGWASRSLHPKLYNYGDTPYQKDYIDWELDLVRQRARPCVEAPLFDGFEIPFAPVLGCIGVAPGQIETTRSADCGRYGGNMDLCAITTGFTILLPVFVEGAYLFLGDGHATQGAGEITGNGIEVSFDVQFSVDILETKEYAKLRGSDRERIYSIANATPLEEACRQATEGMMTWLEESYHCDQSAAGMLMGQLVDYKLGNLVSNAFTIACSIEKRFLSSLTG